MSSVFDGNDNSRSDRYKFAKQYAADIARSKTGEGDPVAPEVPAYTDDWPVCAGCNRPMDHDWDERKYRCNSCIISVRDADIQFSHHNKNRIYKDLSELSAMTPEQHAQNNMRIDAIRTAAANRARLSTQTGADHASGSPATNTSGGTGASSGGNSFYQLGDVHDIARRNNARQSGRFDDHTRTSIREKSTGGGLHPLDVSLQKELGNKVQITSTREVNNRLPNSPGIVDKSVRGGERKPYSRYGESANADYKDPYD